jgi:hypothetical protein
MSIYKSGVGMKFMLVVARMTKSRSLRSLLVASFGFIAAQSYAAGSQLTWSGVWQGSVGKAEVRLCLQGAGNDVNGTYYYTRYLRLIPLTVADKRRTDSQSLVLNEIMVGRSKVGSDKKVAARDETVVWTLRASGDRQGLEGNWRSSAKELPVQLTRVPEIAPKGTTADETQGACEGDSFNLPREQPARVGGADAKLKELGTSYRATALDFGNRFDSEIRSFELLRDDDHARKFNAAQRKALTDEQSAVFECTRSVIGRDGQQGDYNAVVEPVFIGQHWLVARNYGSNDCGGAHPNAYMSYQTWNLDDGRTVDTWTWFNSKGAVVAMEGQGDSRYRTVEIGNVLKTALVKAWPRDDADCKGIVEDGTVFSWVAYPQVRGMTFMPELPHVAYACNEEVTLPWAKVLPLLNASGRKAVDTIRLELGQPPAR